MFSEDLFPEDVSSAIFAPSASRVYREHFGKAGGKFLRWERPAKIQAEAPGNFRSATWETAFDSTNRMVVGFNSYIGGRYVGVYETPLQSRTEPDLYLEDIDGMAYTATFDDNDNLYVGDINRSRVLIYYNPFGNVTEQSDDLQPEPTTSTQTPVPEFASTFALVGPSPPECVVRRLERGAAYRLKFEVTNFHPERSNRLEFRRIAPSDTKLLGFYDVIVHPPNSDGVRSLVVDMRKMGSHIFPDLDRVSLIARISKSVRRTLGTGDGARQVAVQEPITNWSSSFVLSEDRDSCDAGPDSGPTPTVEVSVEGAVRSTP